MIAVGGGEAPAQVDRVNAKQDDLQAEIDEANGEIDALIPEEAVLRDQQEAVGEELRRPPFARALVGAQPQPVLLPQLEHV